MFKKAKIKLTLLYVLILFIITSSLSVLVYLGVEDATKIALQSQRRKMERFYLGNGRTVVIEPFNIETLQEIRQKTIVLLVLINGAILFISGAVAYYLAGKTLEPIEKMVKKQKRFISDSSHELKTPLTAIKTDLEVTLREKKLNISQAKQALYRTLEEIDSINVLANQLLKATKYSENDLHNNIEKINIATTIKNCIKKFNAQAKEKNLKIETVLDEGILHTNKQKIEELFMNILENAIKYSEPNTTITILCKNYKERFQISFIDQGIGISKKDLAFIFEPFYRADTARTRNNNSHGLGLTISKEIVDMLKGSININSTLGKGTTVILTLPKNNN